MDAQQRIERARQFDARGEYGSAERELEAALEADSRAVDAHILLGILYHRRSEFDRALQSFGRAHEADPSNTDVFLLMGNVHNVRGDFDRAGELYRRSIESGAGNRAQAHYELGKLCERRNDYRGAVREHETSLRMAYDTDLALRAILLHKFLGDWERVDELVGEALPKLDRNDLFLNNVFLNEREVAQRKTVLETRPRSFTVSLTSRCNLDCVMCEAKRLSWDMPERTVREVVGYFPYLEHVMWQGGEVFLLDSFKDILREAKKYPRMKQVITSNGMALDDDMIRELADQPDLTLTLSVDGTTKDLFERIRAGASYERLIETIERLNAVRDRSRMKLNVNVTVMKSNHRHLLDFIEFAKRYDFDFVFFTSITGNEHSEENIFLRRDREALDHLSRTIGAVEDRAREYGILLHNWLPVRRIDPPGEEDVRADAPAETAGGPSEGAGGANASPAPAPAEEPVYRGLLCYAPWQRLYIDWKGNFFPDCMCLPEQPAGNVLEHPIAELWNGEGMQEYRRRMFANDCEGLCKPDCISGRIPSEYLKFNR